MFNQKVQHYFKNTYQFCLLFLDKKYIIFGTIRFRAMFHIADNQDCQQVNEVSQDCFFFTFSKKQYGKPINSVFYQIKQKNDVSG